MEIQVIDQIMWARWDLTPLESENSWTSQSPCARQKQAQTEKGTPLFVPSLTSAGASFWHPSSMSGLWSGPCHPLSTELCFFTVTYSSRTQSHVLLWATHLPGDCLQYPQFVVVIKCTLCWKPLSLECLQGLFLISQASQKLDHSACLHRWLPSTRWRAGLWLPKRPCFYTFSGSGVYFFKLC